MKINVSHIAKLASLPLKEEEIAKFEEQLSEVLDYVKKLEEVDTKNVEETSQVTDMKNVFKDDTTRPSLTQDEALSNASTKHNGLFKVKGIFEDE